MKSLVFAALVFGSPSTSDTISQRELVDRVVAVIESDIITLRELEAKAEPYLAESQNEPDPDRREASRREVLTKVLDIQIGEAIVDREIDKSGDKLGVTDADIDAAIAEVQRLNNLSREQLQAALYGQGMTWSEYRSQLRDQIERARLIQFRVQGKVQVDPAEVKRLCSQRQSSGSSDQVCASHILLTIPEGADSDQEQQLKAKASRLQSELSSGADFAAYALEYSDDKSTPDGSLGCFGRGEMVEAFEKAAFATPVTKVSPVIKTSFGFHVIKVTDRKAASTQCESQEDLAPFQNEIYQREVERQMNAWIAELREKSFVDVRL